MNVNFSFPEETDFFSKDFYLSDKNDHDEGIISFVKRYDGGRKLIVTLLPYGYDSSVTAEIVENDSVVSSIIRNKVTSLSFQGWGNEQAIRVYWEDADNEFLIYYDPEPRVFYGELT
ncbi:hypothetical protein TW85_16025 [Marinomonas sp. S3726]|uniref:hypothetical protein n=1 Tax=Marinomonas sp. S3726 TaxID=579484 RepID=UPI0005FA8B75|nr:hypothetical protein [Marinomonas sp. S3726]KJZ12298.1 hypothetical protein TW85_16025 [Marinomonas sp. S3726]